MYWFGCVESSEYESAYRSLSISGNGPLNQNCLIFQSSGCVQRNVCLKGTTQRKFAFHSSQDLKVLNCNVNKYKCAKYRYSLIVTVTSTYRYKCKVKAPFILQTQNKKLFNYMLIHRINYSQKSVRTHVIVNNWIGLLFLFSSSNLILCCQCPAPESCVLIF